LLLCEFYPRRVLLLCEFYPRRFIRLFNRIPAIETPGGNRDQAG
jgi:hypothetical protein